jgi:hypothetical protein
VGFGFLPDKIMLNVGSSGRVIEGSPIRMATIKDEKLSRCERAQNQPFSPAISAMQMEPFSFWWY